ncbi:MAG: enoyl-CoA hydratase/isomerase family protein [Balneolaceae bacterium]|nr:enoyl-CoA hydratase/isomerase family protein [Balneolaceae bacterium]
MNTTFQSLLFEVDEQGICTISINRPEKLNALNNQVFLDLDDALTAADQNPEIRVVIVTGVGEKAFVAGADIKEFAEFTSQQATDLSTRGHRVFQKIEDLSKPVIAAVNGFALGGGCELAMACHIRIASKTAKLGLPEVTLGLIPGYGGTQRLVALCGKAKALELMMTGNFISAEEAEKIGLVNSVSDSAMEAATALAAKMAKQAPLALKNAIKAVAKAGQNDGYLTEATLFGELFATEDFKEGTSAFFEKRKPSFSGK